MYCNQLYVIAHEFSESPWDGIVFDDVNEAKYHLDRIEYHNYLYVLTLKDFMWQLSNRQKSPRILFFKT